MGLACVLLRCSECEFDVADCRADAYLHYVARLVDQASRACIADAAAGQSYVATVADTHAAAMWWIQSGFFSHTQQAGRAIGVRLDFAVHENHLASAACVNGNRCPLCLETFGVK